MPVQNITINAQGTPNPRSANIYKNSANGDNQVQWQSGAGTHTVNGLPTGVFTPEPVQPITVSPGNPSPTYTVASGAGTGTYTYSVDGAAPNGQPSIILNP